MKTATEILRILEGHTKELRGLGVQKIGLFGSAVRNEQTTASDLDFLVELEKKTFDVYMDLKFFLESLFECKVDLVLPETIKPRIKPRILRETSYAQGL